MRVLHWNEGWLPLIGGTEVLLHHLTAEQRRRGNAVAAICDRPLQTLAAREVRGGVDVRRLGLCDALRAGDAAVLRSVAAEVTALRREFRPDVVHLHLNGPSLWFHLLTRQAHPAPVLVTLHTPFAYLALPDGLRDRLLAHAEWVTAVSHSLLGELHSVAPFTRDRSSVVLNALPEPPEPPVPLCFEPATLLAVGRLVPEKGFDVALHAFARLVAHFPGLRFVVVGDGPERGALESLAAALVPADAVTFLGWIDPERVPAVMNGATIVLMPSRWDEPFGLVAVEAAQMARPIVGSRVGGLPEIVVDGVTGLLIDAGDAEAMAVATASLLRDPQRTQQLGYEARLRIRERFSIQSCADAYEAAYVRALAGAHGRSDASEPVVSAAKT